MIKKKLVKWFLILICLSLVLRMMNSAILIKTDSRSVKAATIAASYPCASFFPNAFSMMINASPEASLCDRCWLDPGPLR